MPDVERERKIAAAKRKLRKFKQKRGQDLPAKAQVVVDDGSSLASEENFDENQGGDLTRTNDHNVDQLSDNNSLLHDKTKPFPTQPSAIQEDDIPTNNIDPPLNNMFDNSKLLTKNEDEMNPQNSMNYSGSIHDAPLTTASNAVFEDNGISNGNDLSNEHTEIYAHSDTRDLDTAGSSDEENLLRRSDSTESANVTATHHEKIENDSISQFNNHCEMSVDDTQISTATTEKLLQISTKLNGLAAEAQSLENGSSFATSDQFVLSELENRNQQLAEQVSLLTRQKQDLTVQFEQLAQQMKDLHQRLETEKQQIYAHGVNEQNSLRQQLQVQMQTISILVAEKQELQHQIHDANTSMNHQQSSRQKYQDQLQDSKLRMQTLERELKANTDSVSRLNEVKVQLTEERDQLQAKLQKLTRSNDENSMHVGELSHKLSNKEDECKRLNIELEDLHEKLSMAEVLLQQLSSTSEVSADNQLKQIQEERESLKQKLIEYQQAFEQLTSEREQLSRQYEDVNQQMQKQVQELSEQVTWLETEKNDLQSEVDRLRGVVEMINEKNQRTEDHHQDEVKDKNLEKELRLQLEQSSSDLEKVLAERDDVINKLNAQLRNNERLAKLNEEQETQLIELSRNISDSVVSADEHAKLLEQSQSDKTTISRALVQNKQLKQQLEEMQEGFIKLSNDKMELATQLTTTEHARKELEDEIEKHRVSLSLVEEKLLTKDKTVSDLQNALLQAEVSGQPLSQPVETNSNENLLVELNTSQETVSILGEQNNQLKSMVTALQQQLDAIQQQPISPYLQQSSPASSEDISDTNSTASSGSFDDDERDQDTVSLLSTSLQQLEQEKEDLAKRFDEEQREHAILLEQYNDLKENQTKDGQVSPESHQQLVHNMALLQDRFAKIMEEKVDALNRIEELEHVNLQLQNECDTIGEYITLYHNQRQVLKQRHHEKDEYVSAMAQEREQMQLKLEKLQTLVLTLLNNRCPNTPTQSPLTSSPIKLRDQETSRTQQSGAGEISSEWPNMLNEEENKSVRTSRPDLLPDPEMLRSKLETPEMSDQEEEDVHKPDHYPGKLERVEDSPGGDKDASTATEIISLLEQMQNPAKSASAEFPQGFCLRYMGPYTAI